jgi:FkbM family methyltransferase
VTASDELAGPIPDQDLKRKMTRLRFLPRWARSVRKRIVRLVHGDEYFLTNYFGARFLVRWADFVPREVALKNFEEIQISYFIDACRRAKPDLLIDIGAHMGLYSCILLRKQLVPRAVLFEPNRQTAAHLRANLLLNGVLDKCEIHEYAAGSRRGRANFEVGPDRNSGQAHVVAAGGGEIDVVPVDELLDLTGKVLAIKMDVERYELETLAGMERLLKANRGFVQIEALETRNAVIRLMEEWGYTLTADFYWDLFFEKA